LQIIHDRNKKHQKELRLLNIIAEDDGSIFRQATQATVLRAFLSMDAYGILQLDYEIEISFAS